jgi:hypothetical protein
MNLENLAIKIENQGILENNENLNIVNREIEHQKDEIEHQSDEINFQNAEIKLQNAEIAVQDNEIKEEIKDELKKEIKEEIKNQIENPKEEVVIVVEKPKVVKQKAIEEGKTKKGNQVNIRPIRKLCPKHQHLCPNCQKKYQQKVQTQYEEYPYYQWEEMYQNKFEDPKYYQDYQYLNEEDYGQTKQEARTYQPTAYSLNDYQNLLKIAKPMFKVLKK